MHQHYRHGSAPLALACGIAGWLASLAMAAADCIADMKQPQLPADMALCQRLEDAVRRPSALRLDQYEVKLGDYLRNYCHRGAGWTPDKRVRDTGPFIGTIVDGKWVGKYFGTHAPVLVWYSREMIEWLRRNRPDGGETVANPEPLPDGAVMVKEMFPPPAAACAGIDPLNLRPTSGAAIMVRDAKAAHDGWFWGWFGWGANEWTPDWPAGELTTSFLSICARVKDNRILPRGFLPLRERVAIAAALSAGADLAEEAGPAAVGDDPDYRNGGADSVVYRVPLDGLGGTPAYVQATLYYQATPPYFLQDRFCTSTSEDTRRLYFLAGNLDLNGTPAEGWKLKLVTTGPVAVR